MAAPWFDIRRFGDLPRDGSADWSLVMQAAIDCLIRMHHVTGDPGTLYLPAGIYCINRPLLLCRIDEIKAGAFAFQPFSLSIVGERAGHLGDPQSGVVIHAHLRRTNSPITGFPRPFCMPPGPSDPCGVEGPPRLDRPALIIQGGQTVHLRSLTLCGLNHWIGGSSTRESILTQHLQEDPTLGIDPYRIDGARDNAASPYAGICVDPFSPSVLQDPAPGDPRRRYPDLETYYLPAVASRDLLIEDCQIHDFTVGVCLAPTGDLPVFREGEISLSLVNTTISVAKSCLSIGRYRRAALHGVNLGPAKYAINCVDYGGPGHAPSVQGARIKSVKHVFLTGPTGTSTTLSGLTVQDCLSLGQFSAPRLAGEALDTVRFTGSSFAFIGPADAALALPSMNAHLLNCARTTFQGCRFLPPQADALEPPLSIANLGFLSFLDCALGGRHTRMLTAEGSTFWVTGPAERVLYQNCLTADLPTPAGQKTLTRISCRQQTRSLQEPPFLLGLAACAGPR